MKWVTVDLSKPHGYQDYPQVPERFHRSWEMAIFEPGEAGGELRADGYAYDGADDCVSETIESHGIWEPPETILALSALTAGRSPMMLDFGSQVGWYSALALSCGGNVYAFDANVRALGLTGHTAGRNAGHWPITKFFHPSTTVLREGWRIDLGPRTQVAFAKIDVEGAERHALRALQPLLETGRVDHLLMEVSPCWDIDEANYLVDQMIEDYGYHAYPMPPKRQPPVPFSVFPDDLYTYSQAALHHFDLEERHKHIGTLWQENVWFCRPGAPWG